MSARWITSTGAGDDVLEVTHDAGVVSTGTAATIRRLADEGHLGVFGDGQADVEAALRLYRIAHEPAIARQLEDDARAALAARRSQETRMREAGL